jgi:hypothetical protein
MAHIEFQSREAARFIYTLFLICNSWFIFQKYTKAHTLFYFIRISHTHHCVYIFKKKGLLGVVTLPCGAPPLTLLFVVQSFAVQLSIKKIKQE